MKPLTPEEKQRMISDFRRYRETGIVESKPDWSLQNIAALIFVVVFGIFGIVMVIKCIISYYN